MVVHVLCFVGFMFWEEGCETGLPECRLGCGYDLAYGSVLVDGYGRWIYFVRTLVGWFIL